MISNKIKARAHILGNSISTDMIIPFKNIAAGDGFRLAEHAFVELDKNLAKQIKNGDVLIAGLNFGVCHHPNPHHPLEMAITCLKELGISCLIAESFARFFYRAAINNGLILLESKEAFRMVAPSEEIEINIPHSEITCREGTIKTSPFPESIIKIVEAGGLIPYAKKAIGKR